MLTIIDIRETVGPGIDAAIGEEHPIRIYGVHGDKVLGGAGTLEVVFLPVAGFHLLFTLEHFITFPFLVEFVCTACRSGLSGRKKRGLFSTSRERM